MTSRRVAVIGGGPAGLMAAEVLSLGNGLRIDLYDAMPSVGRKFLLAGIGGLNLTHSETLESFLDRYGPRRAAVEPWIRAFGPSELRAWAAGLGIETFVGSSGRVFPRDMKAAPLLRAWLHRLRAGGVRLHMRHRWLGWDEQSGELRFAAGEAGQGAGLRVAVDAVVLALGGASWPRLGSDGAWVPMLQARGVRVAPLRPANCGFDVAHPVEFGGLVPGWTDWFASRFAGQPLKNVALSIADTDFCERPGEFIVTATGIEGSLVYAAAAAARERIDACGGAVARVDLLPGRPLEAVQAEVGRPRGSRSLATHLKSRLGIDGVKSALLHELLPADVFDDAARLAAAIKSVPLPLVATRPIAEAISSTGGVAFESLTAGLLLGAVPGVACAGEMLDWEAPTGGYLLTACLASGRAAAAGVLRFLDGR